MTEIDDIRGLLDQGFRAAMILRQPTEEEIRQLPGVYAKSTVKALPLMHPDGRKLMYYLRDPAAMDFARGLVEEQNAIIGCDLFVYCSGTVIQPRTPGRTVLPLARRVAACTAMS